MSKTANKKVNLLLIGLSKRGKALLDLLLEMDDVNVAAVCDVYEDRLQNAVQAVEKVYGKKPAASTDYRALLDVPGLDAVFTPSSWTSHVQVCLDAMNAGLYAATEVGGATSVQQCWDLVRTSEKTGKPCMLMENCCYGQEELTILNMVKLGLFGELVHAEGGYRHDLRREICMGHVDRHYRLDNYLHRNGDVYPTHDVGPIAKYLNINRGNRMLSLVSVASKSVGNEAWVKSHLQQYPQLEEINGRDFAMGDVVVTTIKCAMGETITLFHDTSLPRPYSRDCRVQGTKGIWLENAGGIYLEGVSPKKEEIDVAGNPYTVHEWDKVEDFYEQYDHPLWKEYRDHVVGGHGGMDALAMYAFLDAVRRRSETPIDVYDCAAWMSITCLSEQSIALGGMPVPFPDFTSGKWVDRKPETPSVWSLNEVCES